jgi:hypothetical protein
MLLLVVAYFMNLEPAPTPRWSFITSTIQNVALIVVTIVIVDFLWQIVGGEPVGQAIEALGSTLTELRGAVDLLEDSHRTGLQRLHGVAGAAGSQREWMERLESATSAVDLMGYTLHVWTGGESFETTVLRMVRAGVRFRVVIMHEDNPSLSALVNQDQITALTLARVREDIKAATRAFLHIQAQCNQLSLDGFHFRLLRSGLIVTQLCRTDSRLTSIQYLFSSVASRSPLLDVSGSDTELFRIYVQEFEAIWSLATG